MTNGLAHHYHLGESTVILEALGVIFIFLLNVSLKFFSANRIAPDGTPHSAASHLGLFYLPRSHKKDARLI